MYKLELVNYDIETLQLLGPIFRLCCTNNIFFPHFITIFINIIDTSYTIWSPPHNIRSMNAASQDLETPTLPSAQLFVGKVFVLPAQW